MERQSPSDTRIVLQHFQDVLVVPMPDPLSQDFLEALQNSLLQTLHHSPVRGVILDLSGVELLDATDFSQLHQIWQTTHLLGAAMVLAGIKPGVSASLITLGIKDDWVQSALSVDLALERLS